MRENGRINAVNRVIKHVRVNLSARVARELGTFVMVLHLETVLMSYFVYILHVSPWTKTCPAISTHGK